MDRKNTYNINQEELEETLSFCDLSLENDQDLDDTSHHSPNSPSYGHDIFEFPFIPNTPLNNNNKANDIVFGGKLIKEKEFVGGDGDGDQSFRSQSYSCLRKHKALIGITKIEPKMELSDMKKRQSRRNHPLPMFPPMANGDMAVVDTGDGCNAGGKRGHRWSLLKPLRCRPNLFSTATKASLGCIPRV
ncbi:hypothetical protein ERO13_D13G023700v2 [Gossypium hirsutum]|uniref:Uncharacterized protein n=4 Tax=Gossypium TaxID=3633 RepID=A0ABM3BFP2_GOSHI|nr:uncharacterized protein LOC107918670 [Gossypium hirsutum]KAB1993376.1 hypothetical protein ES319_D13G026700v1 [Gossypium barbadense]TYG35982.1 hypothetical protein ES288_D13G028200v1 [Gossypium darwinii]TYI45292.1 hypothetical protein E1A91_D13G027100v1 [Gossypium mustelinum]KAG4110024.1 hypothetical protein ERO13_D13G023700v2 [Gossypium hirsutum]PPD68988.1 hypothetical protein GOBAR_DD34134 [Gossypium barbadense]